jgi:hypothetical protein
MSLSSALFYSRWQPVFAGRQFIADSRAVF